MSKTIQISMPVWTPAEEGWEGAVTALDEAGGRARVARVQLTPKQYADSAYRTTVEGHLRDSLMSSFPEADATQEIPNVPH